MNDKRVLATVLEHRDEQTEAETERATTSEKQFTTMGENRQTVVSDFLGHGQSAAVPLRHLKELTGLPGRELRRQIEAERRSWVLILSDNQRGYFLADSPEEVAQFVKSMIRRSSEIAKTAKIVGRAAGIGGE